MPLVTISDGLNNQACVNNCCSSLNVVCSYMDVFLIVCSVVLEHSNQILDPLTNDLTSIQPYYALRSLFQLVIKLRICVLAAQDSVESLVEALVLVIPRRHIMNRSLAFIMVLVVVLVIITELLSIDRSIKPPCLQILDHFILPFKHFPILAAEGDDPCCRSWL